MARPRIPARHKARLSSPAPTFGVKPSSTGMTRRALQAACFPVGAAALGLAFVNPALAAAPLGRRAQVDGVAVTPTAPAAPSAPAAAPAPAAPAAPSAPPASATSAAEQDSATRAAGAAPADPATTVATTTSATPASDPAPSPVVAPAASAPSASRRPLAQRTTNVPPAHDATSDGSVGAAANSPLVLPTVKVEGESGSYRRADTDIARVPTALINTPQTVAVVSREVIQEQRASTVRDALRNVSGITMAAGEGGRQGDTFILRGFSAQNDVFRDGARDMGFFTRDTFNLDGVEVFFGPSSVIFGRGSTGGAINLKTKTPQRGTFADVALGVGTASHGRVEADANHRFENGHGVRISAMGQSAGIAGRNEVEQKRAGVAPSVRFVLGDNTTLGLDYLYQRERSVPDYGLPFYNGRPVSEGYGVDRSTFYGVAGVSGADTENVDAHIASARFTHSFSPAFRLTNLFRAGTVDRLARPTAPRNLAPAVDPTSIGRQRFESDINNANFLNQIDLRMEGATGFLQHVANLGVEVAWERRKQTRHNLQLPGTGTAVNVPADLRAPNPAPDLSGVSRIYQNFQRGTMKTASVYASDQIKLLPSLELLGSARLDTFDTQFRTIAANGTVTPLAKDDLLLNWRGGVVVHPQDKTSLYAMVGSSANPSAEAGTLSDATVSLDPEKNLAYEVGAKADVLAERLNLGLALFMIDKTNARVPGTDPAGPAQILAGKQRVQGLNAGAAGTITDAWKLIGSYTFLRSRIRSHTNQFLVGQDLPGAPPHSLSLWSTYAPIARLTLGGGTVFQSETAVNNPAAANTPLNKVPSFLRFDAFASYELPSVVLQVNVANLTNELYYDQQSGSQAVPAEGRVVLVTGRLRI
jgi:catecholate siderophore receptor